MDAPGLFLPDVWTLHGRWRRDRIAVVAGERRIDWGTFDARLNRVANALTGAGLSKGAKVAFLLPTGLAALECILGAMKAGLVAVPLSTLNTCEVTAAMVADSSAAAVVSSPELLVLLATAELPDVRVCMGSAPDGWMEYDAFLAAAPSSTPVVDRDAEDEMVIIYSSGTTGTPKGIVHTHRTRHHLAYGMGVELAVTDRSVVLVTTGLPSNGTWLLLFPALLAGGTVVLMERFVPDDFIRLAVAERVTHSFLVPPQFAAVIGSPSLAGPLPGAPVLLSGGAPFAEPLKRAAVERLSPNITELYGCTEGVGTIIKSPLLLEKPRSVGLPLLGSDIMVLVDGDRSGGPGEVGEVLGYGPGLMKGYHNRPEATEEVIWCDAKGRTWLRTGDIGRLDEDACLEILDRRKDMIVSGGLNVFAGDIEPVMAEHPGVAEVAVIGVPDARWGEVPMALIVPGAPGIDAEEIRAWANGRLAKHQRLSGVEFRDAFPRNALGKVLKRELREPYWRDNA